MVTAEKRSNNYFNEEWYDNLETLQKGVVKNPEKVEPTIQCLALTQTDWVSSDQVGSNLRNYDSFSESQKETVHKSIGHLLSALEKANVLEERRDRKNITHLYRIPDVDDRENYFNDVYQELEEFLNENEDKL